MRGLPPGCRFTLTNHPRDDQNKDLVVLRCAFRIRNNDYEGTGGTQSAQFHINLEAIPADRQFRPIQKTPKPRSYGPETATVTGPEGAVVHTTEHGEVYVQFRWDRYNSGSCPIRVATPWAGENFGMVSLPRVGHEVVVDYIDGDPDRPIIIASVYNGDNRPPWGLPANASQSGILSRSLGGGYEQANAIRFEDLPGKEQLWLRAQKDKLDETENDEKHWVGNDRAKNIDRDEATKIGRHRSEDVTGNETILIHGDRNEEVDGEEVITLHKSRTTEIDDNEVLLIHKDRQTQIDGHETLTVGQTRTMRITGSESLTVGGDKQDAITKNLTIKVGKNKTETVTMALTQSVGLARMDTVGAAYSLNVGGAMNTVVGVSQSEQITVNKSTTVGVQYGLTVGGVGGEGGSSISMDGESITLKVGESELALKADGSITVNGKTLSVSGSEHIQLGSERIDVN